MSLKKYFWKNLVKNFFLGNLLADPNIYKVQTGAKSSNWGFHGRRDEAGSWASEEGNDRQSGLMV